MKYMNSLHYIMTDRLPDNFTQSIIFLDKVIWEIYRKPNQQISSILKRQLHPDLWSYIHLVTEWLQQTCTLKLRGTPQI